MEIKIIAETDDWVAIDKPANILSIPDRKGKEISVRSLLQQKRGEIFTVHRLDKETSGVILFAKNAEAHKFLSQQFQERTIIKDYQGIVQGELINKSDKIEVPIAEHPSKKGMMRVVKNGKPSVTVYEVLEEFGKYSLVQFRIETGRTHQIRVHMKHLDHPIVCDSLYGNGKPVYISGIKKNYKLSRLEDQEKPMLSRLGLHAYRLSFMDKDGRNYELEAEMPKDMRALLKQLRKWK